MRHLLAFIAGFVSTLVFHQGVVALLHLAGVFPRPAWSMTPTWPLHIPQVISSALWAGLWAVLIAFLVARIQSTLGYWFGWILFGAVLPTVVALFVVLPLKGRPIAGGWDIKLVLGGLLVNGIWGAGCALVLRLLERIRHGS
jgi:hypothetical protein